MHKKREAFEAKANEIGMDLSIEFFEDWQPYANSDTRLAYELFDAGWTASLSHAEGSQHLVDASVTFVDGLGASRNKPSDCREGLKYITAGPITYWPLSTDDEQRLRRAECGDGEFHGPTVSHAEGEAKPVATKLHQDPYDERDGFYASAEDWERLRALPPGTMLYTHPAPTKGEEIHVNVDGDSVYTLPLEPTGMAAPRFVVHVPAPDEREIAARALDKVAKELALRAIPGGVDDALERNFCVNTLRSEAARLRTGKEGEWQAALSHAEGEAGPVGYLSVLSDGTRIVDTRQQYDAPEVWPLYTHPAPQAVPDGWDDRHTKVTAFALWNFINYGYHRANIAAQKGQPGSASEAEAILDDVKTAEEARRILATPTAPAGEQHPDDTAVDRFAAAMKAKLAKKRAEGRSGWDDKGRCSQEFLSRLLRDHVGKGDPVDVANLAMMLHQRGEVIQQPVSDPDGLVPDEPVPITLHCPKCKALHDEFDAMIDRLRAGKEGEPEKVLKINPDNPPQRYDAGSHRMTRCQADDDGDCTWEGCPQLRDGEPKKTGRHCPWDTPADEEHRDD